MPDIPGRPDDVWKRYDEGHQVPGGSDEYFVRILVFITGIAVMDQVQVTINPGSDAGQQQQAGDGAQQVIQPAVSGNRAVCPVVQRGERPVDGDAIDKHHRDHM